ncbi:MAG TPA: RcnB family protein [Mesorhizobium sp.]|jgi:Ni/Co efflux regulator RcnB
MKRLVLAAVAASFLAAPMISAQAAPMVAPIAAPSANVVHVDWKKPNQVQKRKVVVTKKVVRKQQWKRGQRYSDWRRHQAVSDYNRHGLQRPGRGQEWIKVDNNYLLVGIASGVIGAMIAAH